MSPVFICEFLKIINSSGDDSDSSSRCVCVSVSVCMCARVVCVLCVCLQRLNKIELYITGKTFYD